MSLNLRAWFGLAQLLFALALMLFVTAGTLRYWHAWWYIAIFGMCAAAITVYLMKHDRALLERRMSVGPRAETETKQKIIMVFSGLSFVALYVLSSLDHRLKWSSVSPFAVEIGEVLVIVGFTIVFLVFRVNSHTAGTIRVETDQNVIEDGPYSVVRHPMYAGGLVMLLGTPVALGSWWGEVALIPVTASLIWRLIEEEKFLTRSLPGYHSYTKRVRSRLLPQIY